MSQDDTRVENEWLGGYPKKAKRGTREELQDISKTIWGATTNDALASVGQRKPLSEVVL